MGLEDRERLSPGDHNDKDVRKALKAALKLGNGGQFVLVKGGHWGLLICTNGCCCVQVNGTPRVPWRHARDLLRDARRCPLPDDHPSSRKRS